MKLILDFSFFMIDKYVEQWLSLELIQGLVYLYAFTHGDQLGRMLAHLSMLAEVEWQLTKNNTLMSPRTPAAFLILLGDTKNSNKSF